LAKANGNSIIPNQMFFFISSIYFVSVFFWNTATLTT
jgi:hypothetical protein